jgi:hypothetical protein
VHSACVGAQVFAEHSTGLSVGQLNSMVKVSDLLPSLSSFSSIVCETDTVLLTTLKSVVFLLEAVLVEALGQLAIYSTQLPSGHVILGQPVADDVLVQSECVALHVLSGHLNGVTTGHVAFIILELSLALTVSLKVVDSLPPLPSFAVTVIVCSRTSLSFSVPLIMLPPPGVG